MQLYRINKNKTRVQYIGLEINWRRPTSKKNLNVLHKLANKNPNVWHKLPDKNPNISPPPTTIIAFIYNKLVS